MKFQNTSYNILTLNHPMLNNVGHSAFSFARASFLMSSRRSRKRFFQNTNLSGSSLLGRTRHVNVNHPYFWYYSLLCVSGYKDVIFCWFLFQKEGDPDPSFLHQVFLDGHPEVAELWFQIRLPVHGLQLISNNLHEDETMLGNVLAFAKIVLLLAPKASEASWGLSIFSRGSKWLLLCV